MLQVQSVDISVMFLLPPVLYRHTIDWISYTLDDKGTMQLSGGSSHLLDRPSLVIRAFNHFRL